MLARAYVAPRRLPLKSRNQNRTALRALMLPHEPTWATVGLFSAGSVALGAIATASIINALNRRNSRSSEPKAKRQKVAPPSPEKAAPVEHAEASEVAAVPEVQQIAPVNQPVAEEPAAAAAEPAEDAPGTPDAEPHGVLHSDSVVDLQKLQELEQRVADLNALAELGKVYQDSLALSAQLRNLSSFRLQQDKVLGRGSLAVVQEGEYAGDSVAVKLLPIGSVFAEDSRKEACLALCLHHPNIVRVVGVHLVEVEAKPYLALVQETAPGGDLGWQIEDCDFHTGKRGAASMDVAIKLLLDAARGLAYMHDVDVVHGDVKSRNLLVFWEEDEQSDTAQDDDNTTAAAGSAEDAHPSNAAAAVSKTGTGQQDSKAAAASRGSSDAGDKVLVWGLKWCDFGVSFRAAEAPDGIKRTVTGTPGFRAPEVMDIGWSKAADTYAYGIIAWQLLTGEKPIVYDREWRMHMPNPNLMRVDRTGGIEQVPKQLADLVWDCGAYNAKDRPSMREVVERLEDIALQRLQKQQAAEAEQARQQAAAAAEADAKAAAEAQAAAEQQQQAADAKRSAQQAASKAETAAAAAAAQSAMAPPQPADAAAWPSAAAVDSAGTCPTCQQLSPLPCHGYGGLARAMSIAAREAAAGGAAADAAAAAHYQQLLQKDVEAARGSLDRQPSGSSEGVRRPSSEVLGGRSVTGRHHFEVLIQNDDDPITAEAVAHALEQYEGSSLSNKVLSGHPQALQLQHQHHEQQQLQHNEQQQHQSESLTMQRSAGGDSGLQHCATAPVHSHLLDTAADMAAAGAAGDTAAAAAVAAAASGPAALDHARSTSVPSPPLNITGAVSRNSIELVPAQGPGLVPASPAPAAAGGMTGPATAAAAAAGSSAAAGGGAPSGWYLASGSSFKKGMWLEKLTADGAPTASPQTPVAAPAATVTQALPADSSMLSPVAAVGGSRGFSGSAFGAVSVSPGAAAFLQSPAGDRVLPDASALLPGGFSIQLRREPTVTLPAVAEDEQQEGRHGSSAAAEKPGSTPPDDAESAAARLLRRQHTTRRLGTDVLAAAGALSKALSALSSASQALPVSSPVAAAAGPSDPAAAAVAGVVGSNMLLTQDFVAAARGLSEALAGLLPSAAALADVAPDQGAAAAAAASEAVQGLRTLQGQIEDAAAAAAAAVAEGPQQQSAAAVGDSRESAFASPTILLAEAEGINIPAANGNAADQRHSQDHEQQLPVGAGPASDGLSRSINLGSLYSFPGTSLGSSLGSGLNRRHSVGSVRPSFAVGAAAGGSAAAAAGAGRDSSPQPVLMRMPSIRQRKSLLSAELGRQ